MSSVADVLNGLPSASAWQERMYKDLHAHPELSFQETRTSALAAAKLKDLGYEVLEQIGRTGVVGSSSRIRCSATAPIAIRNEALRSYGPNRQLPPFSKRRS